MQILWVNLLTASALGMTLAFEPSEPGTMRRSPRRPDEPILSRILAWRILFVSVLAASLVFAMFLGALRSGETLETARTLAVNTLVALEIAYLFSVRYVHGTSLTWQGVLGTREVLIGVGIVALAQLAFTYLPPMQRIFDTRPLSVGYLLAILAVAALFLIAVEAEKLLRRRLGHRPA